MGENIDVLNNRLVPRMYWASCESRTACALSRIRLFTFAHCSSLRGGDRPLEDLAELRFRFNLSRSSHYCQIYLATPPDSSPLRSLGSGITLCLDSWIGQETATATQSSLGGDDSPQMTRAKDTDPEDIGQLDSRVANSRRPCKVRRAPAEQ